MFYKCGDFHLFHKRKLYVSKISIFKIKHLFASANAAFQMRLRSYV